MGKPLILVVEDEGDVRDGLAAVLRFEGYPVITAGDGRQALVLLQTGLRPCLILLDLMMPVMDGIEFRQKQREHPALRDIPVLVLSGVVHLFNDARGMNVAGMLKKPVDIDAMLGLVAAHCGPPSLLSS